MSLSLLKIDVKADFVKETSIFIKNLLTQGHKKAVFISANKRLIRFVSMELEIEDLLKIEFYTIEDFVKKINFDFLKPSPILHTQLQRDLFFLNLIKKEMPELYENLGNSDSKVLVWAKRLSRLFDEIDRHNLKEKLQNFHYTEALKPAKKILEKLKKLYEIYEEKYENFGFNGKFFKNAASIVKKDEFKQRYQGLLFFFAGLMFLTASEKEVLKSIADISDIFFIIQTDLMERDKIKIYGKEYGFESFLAADKVINQLKDIQISHTKQIIGDDSPTNVRFYEVPNTHYEASLVAEKIKKIIESIPDKKNPRNIGIVLPDATFLFPLLSFIGNDFNVPLNITMGYPFGQTDFGFFLEQLFLFLIDLDRKYKSTGKLAVSTKSLIKLLNTNIASLLTNKFEIETLKEKIFSSPSPIYIFKDEPIWVSFLKIFWEIKNFRDLYTAFMKLYNNIDTLKLKQEEIKFTAQTIHFFYTEVVNGIKDLNQEITLDPSFLYHFIKEAIQDLSIPFEGHPLEGIQIMGMLEARMLSFKYVFIPDVNEGILPVVDKIDPLIPEDIKRLIGLTSFKEKEMLMKYYFFRLFYSSDNTFIIYKIGTTGTDKHIRSRFVEQLMLLEEIKSRTPCPVKKFNINLPYSREGLKGIERDELIDEHFKNVFEGRYISPTQIDLYISCPYRYYLKKIKKIETKITFEDNFEANYVGSLIHYLLEKHFSPYIEQIIDENIYLQIKNNILKDIKNFPDQLKINDKDIVNYLERLSEFQLEALKIILEFRLKNFFINTSKKTLPFRLLATEKKLEDSELKLFGFADRIDEIYYKDESIIRIVDYKTGMFLPFPKITKIDPLVNNIKFENYDKESLEEINDIVGSVQIPAYIIMGKRKFINKKIKATIFQISKKERELIKNIDEQHMDNFIIIIKYLINHMKNTKFIYALSGNTCRFCEYAHFCKFCEK